MTSTRPNYRNRSFKGRDLRRRDLSNADLRGCDFRAAQLQGACLRGTRLGQTPQGRSRQVLFSVGAFVVGILGVGLIALGLFAGVLFGCGAVLGLIFMAAKTEVNFAWVLLYGLGFLLIYAIALVGYFALVLTLIHKDYGPVMGAGALLPVALYFLVSLFHRIHGLNWLIAAIAAGSLLYLIGRLLQTEWQRIQQSPGTRFNRADLTGATFECSEISHADFTNAILDQVNWQGARFSHCRFDWGAAMPGEIPSQPLKED